MALNVKVTYYCVDSAEVRIQNLHLLKQKLHQMTKEHVRNHHGSNHHPLLSSTTPGRAEGRLES